MRRRLLGWLAVPSLALAASICLADDDPLRPLSRTADAPVGRTRTVPYRSPQARPSTAARTAAPRTTRHNYYPSMGPSYGLNRNVPWNHVGRPHCTPSRHGR